MDVTLKYADGHEEVLYGCEVSLIHPTEDIHFSNRTVESGFSKQPYCVVEVPMSYDSSGSIGYWNTAVDYKNWELTSPRRWPDPSIKIATDSNKLKKILKETEEILNKERRDKMISRRVFNEALAEEGISKADRRKVEKLSDADFEYLVASLLASVFDPEMLKVFEPDVQKVKVVEE